nr:PREDICTED: metastasis-suppressor KiSS-1-like [Lepisosteus oculatus]XP_015197900.1 PREDICTED: metastasis-suppressor KiSS-1-like [Lepisosteus oculatus]XP_015197901.1 PREDICTED: metastasis-suppressor KiSS-1-like [Lepisosteus oculatus]XP_015197902.1 PREDICTED: metastasis-suppressor KiSS-1-like [Lepisosteus oculatus]
MGHTGKEMPCSPLRTESTMLLLTMMLMMSVQLVEPWAGHPQISSASPTVSGKKPEPGVQDILRRMSTTPPPGARLILPAAGKIPPALASLLFGSRFPRRGGWAQARPQPPAAKREKNLSAYNWNSFGLRYGKRRSNTPPPQLG